MSGSSKTVKRFNGLECSFKHLSPCPIKVSARGREEAGQDAGCLYLSGLAGGPQGFGLATLLLSVSCNILAAAASGGGVGGAASLRDQPQMKSEKQVDVPNEAR